MSALFKLPAADGSLTVILIALLTRCRAEDGHVPGD